MPRQQCRHRQEQVSLNSWEIRGQVRGETRCGVSGLAWFPGTVYSAKQLSN